MTDTSAYLLALQGTGLTYGLTAVGSAFVFLRRSPNPKFLSVSLGFAAGVMIAASFWSLLLPAIEICEVVGIKAYVWPAFGFICGALLMRFIDQLLPHLHAGAGLNEVEGIRVKLPVNTLLILAITIHNLPEGMAVGVGFSGAGSALGVSDLSSAWALAIGIGIQNLPEGLAVSVPLREGGFSRIKSFLYGQFSGLVEPLGGLLGVAMAEVSGMFLPFVLSFAAGAMIYVVVEEVIPESQRSGQHDWATMGTIFGFVCMMVLDVALG